MDAGAHDRRSPTRSQHVVRQGAEMPKLDGVIETALYVDDLERASAFYETKLGLAPLLKTATLFAYDVGGQNVLLLFLRSIRSSAVIFLSIAVSIVGMFLLMKLMGRSLNVPSLAGIAFAVGMLVDNFIVVLENIYRHHQQGETALAATIKGTQEVWGAVIAATLANLAVFIPVLFISGVLGRLFREFSVTICVAILISGVVSVTLTPMLCSRFLRRPTGHGGGRFGRWSEGAFERLLGAYDRTLQVVLAHRGTTMVSFAGILALTALLFILVPKGFIPDQDTDQIAVVTEAARVPPPLAPFVLMHCP